MTTNAGPPAKPDKPNKAVPQAQPTQLSDPRANQLLAALPAAEWSRW